MGEQQSVIAQNLARKRLTAGDPPDWSVWVRVIILRLQPV
jgi:hypothetical protein